MNVRRVGTYKPKKKRLVSLTQWPTPLGLPNFNKKIKA